MTDVLAIGNEYIPRLVTLLLVALLVYALWRVAEELPLLSPRIQPLPTEDRAEVVALLATSLRRLTP